MDVFGIIGNPVGHSLSPPMHEAAYAELGMDARYVTFEPPKESLEAALDGAAALGISGLNVTIPFKEAVLSRVTPDALAERIGAVNTIDFSTAPPTGYNTDATGTQRAFAHHDVPLDDQTVVVLGAGGAGRAVAFAMMDAGADVTIVNRTVDRARELAAALEVATGTGLDAIPSVLETSDILVNATSVGMEEDRSLVPQRALHSDLVVMDAVYRPLRTKLLREAERAGARTIDGGWMLLYQGVAAFEQWTDQTAPMDVMNNALRERL